MLLRITGNSRLIELDYIISATNRVRPNTRWLSAILCAWLCASSCIAEAVQIGEITSLSKLGVPLHAEVAFTAAPNEKIDNSCLSLIAPDTNAEDAPSYVVDAKPTIQNNGGQPYILLTTYKAFNEVFAKFKLQIKCRDQGSIAKIFTVLPDLDEAAFSPAAIMAATEKYTPPAPLPSSNPSSTNQTPQSSSASDATPTNESNADFTHRADRPTKRSGHSFNRTVVARHPRLGSLGGFKLKISGEPLDATRIGKISEEERVFLLASQKLLDSDDMMASVLALQNQVKQLQDDLGEMRAKIALLDTAPAHINPNELTSIQTAKVASAPDAATTTQPVVTNKSDWRTWSWQIGLLVLMIAGLIWGLRRYLNNRSTNASPQLWPEIDHAESSQDGMHFQVKQPTPSIIPDYVITEPIEENSAKHTRNVVTPPTKTYTAPQPLPAEVESAVSDLIEEAHLYAKHNHPHRAVKILQELLIEHPKKIEAWLLLFAIYSSLSLTKEFETSVLNFLKHNPKEGESWNTIQALGRTLDDANPIYKDATPPISPSDVLNFQHLLGDVLIDLNILLPEELHHCLASFDPKKHGRFGAYLVTQGSITHEQLTQAIIHQQSLNQGLISTPKQPAEDVAAPPDLKFEFPDNH